MRKLGIEFKVLITIGTALSKWHTKLGFNFLVKSKELDTLVSKLPSNIVILCGLSLVLPLWLHTFKI